VVIEILPIQIIDFDSWLRWNFQAQMKIIDLNAHKNRYSGRLMSKDKVKRMTDKMVQVINKTFLAN
jgi:hypothetical protein